MKCQQMRAQPRSRKASCSASSRSWRTNSRRLRCNPDHHGVGLVGGTAGPAAKRELDHFAFEVATLDEVFRARQHLREHNVPIVFEGRRRAGAQIAIEFHDPDGHHLEMYWGVDQIGTEGRVRPAAEWRGAKTLEEAVANPVPGQDTGVS